MTESEADDLPDTLPVAVKASLVNQKPLDKDIISQEINRALNDSGVDPKFIATLHKDLMNYENPTIQLKALELYYRKIGAFTEKIEHSGSVNISASLKEARSRVANYDASNN